jgi:nitrogen regulatory protein PII
MTDSPTPPTSTPWTDLPAMAKIEVVVEGDDVPAVRDLFHDAGATGYTTLTGLSGFGHGGHHQGRLLFNDRASLSMLITVVSIGRADGLIAGIRRLLEDRSGVFFVSEVHVSRPDYFG